jgi:uncharacterized protein
MRILLTSDLSNRTPRIPQEDIDSSDFILIAGDITMGARSEKLTRKVFTKIANLFPEPKPIYLIPGNHDSPDLAGNPEYFPPNVIQMHNKIKTIADPVSGKSLLLLGFGGSSRIPFFSPEDPPNRFTWEDCEFYDHLDNLFQRSITENNNRKIFTLLFIHDPPFNTTLDQAYNAKAHRKHVGSQSVRKIIETYQPNLVVAGHIHESPSVDQLGTSILVNAGEGKFHKYALIDIDLNQGTIKVELKESSAKK